MTPDTRSGTSKGGRFDYQAFLAKYQGATITKYTEGETIYAHGDPADSAFYIIGGAVKIAVISQQGREAVIALLKADDFFGEECLHPQRRRSATVTATTACEIARLDRSAIARALGDDPEFAKVFLNHVLNQNEKLREDLVDQLFNSSEKRLARVLLTLANSGPNDRSNEIAIPVTQETLANMVGTTRSRINQFMTKFRKLGYVDYDGTIRVYDSLMNVIASEQPEAADC